MNTAQHSQPARWAPWWMYVIPVVAINQLRVLLVPPDEIGDAVSVALFAATTVVVILAVTAVYRLLNLNT